MSGRLRYPDLRCPDWLRHELAELMAQLDPGEWGELGVCPGPFGCLFSSDEERLAHGVMVGNFCDGCRVIRIYRPKEEG